MCVIFQTSKLLTPPKDQKRKFNIQICLVRQLIVSQYIIFYIFWQAKNKIVISCQFSVKACYDYPDISCNRRLYDSVGAKDNHSFLRTVEKLIGNFS